MTMYVKGVSAITVSTQESGVENAPGFSLVEGQVEVLPLWVAQLPGFQRLWAANEVEVATDEGMTQIITSIPASELDGGSSTTITATGILKGTGSSVVPAVAGTDYVQPGGALGTPSSGDLENCTFPTLNQNTTGSAASLTTSRTVLTNLASTSTATFNGTANITPGIEGMLPAAHGGTGLSAPGGIGYALKSNGSAWVSDPPILLYVNDYGADPTGATDSTAAFVTAQAAGGSDPYLLVAGVGAYKIGTSENLTTFGQFQGMIGQGSALTTIDYVGADTCIYAYNADFTASSTGGVFGGFFINGANASAGAIGMSVGNLNTIRAHDIQIWNFSGSASIGLQFKNSSSPAGNSEQSEWTAIMVGYCADCVVFDTGSFDYSVYQFLIEAEADQNGITLQNDASLAGCRLEVRGNFTTGASNTGYVLGLDPEGAGSGSSFISNGLLYVNVECDGSTGIGHTTIAMGGSSSCQLIGMGVMSFLESSSIQFQGASLGDGPVLSFNGIFNDPGLGLSNSDSLIVQGGSQWSSIGSGTTNTLYNGMYIYPELGDFQAFAVPDSAITIAGIYTWTYLRAKRMTLLFRQPSGGGGVTPIWPTNWEWASGNSTLSTAANAVDIVELEYFPSESKWYARLATTYSTTVTPLSVGQGGTGTTTLSGLVKGVGTSAFTTAVSGTDYMRAHWVNVLDYGADPTGVNDSTEALTNAIAALPVTGDWVYAPTGAYKISSTLEFVGLQRLKGDGQGSTVFYYYGTGPCINATDPMLSTGGAVIPSGLAFDGFTLDGSNAGTGAVGLQIGSADGSYGHDLRIQFFESTGGVGLYFNNSSANVGTNLPYCDRGRWDDINFYINSTAVVFDSGTADYALYDFYIEANANQCGVTLQNGVQLYGTRMRIGGDFGGGTGSNSGWVLGVDQTGIGNSWLANTDFDISVECNGSGVGHYTVVAGTASATSVVAGTGVMVFMTGSLTFQGASIHSGSRLAVSGYVSDPVLGFMQYGDCAAFGGGTQWRVFGSPSYVLPSQINPTMGDCHEYLLSSGVNTVSSFYDDPYLRARKLLLLLHQPASGNPGTLVLPSNVVLLGNATLSAANGATDLLMLNYYPSNDTWYGVIQPNGSPLWTSTATSGTTITLVVNSAGIQEFTGTTAQTVKLPETSVVAGMQWKLINASTQPLTVQGGGGGAVNTLQPRQAGTYIANTAAPSYAGWDYTVSGGPLSPPAGTTTQAPLVFTAGTLETTPAAGAVEFDTTNFYATAQASARQMVDTEQFCMLSSTLLLLNQTGAQAIFGNTNGGVSANGAVQLAVGTYFFECCFALTGMSSTSGNYGFALGGGATFTQAWTALAGKTAAFAAGTTEISFNTAANIAIASANTNITGVALIKGEVLVTVAGTLIPQVSLEYAAAPTVQAGSSFRIWPAGHSVQTVGNWS